GLFIINKKCRIKSSRCFKKLFRKKHSRGPGKINLYWLSIITAVFLIAGKFYRAQIPSLFKSAKRPDFFRLGMIKNLSGEDPRFWVLPLFIGKLKQKIWSYNRIRI